MKKLLIFIIFLLLIPISVNAGIMCSDGWESSCITVGPGCCSHHGGVSNRFNYNGSSFSNGDSFVDRLTDGEYSGILILIILFVLISLDIYMTNKKDKSRHEEINEAVLFEKNMEENREINNKFIFLILILLIAILVVAYFYQL